MYLAGLILYRLAVVVERLVALKEDDVQGWHKEGSQGEQTGTHPNQQQNTHIFASPQAQSSVLAGKCALRWLQVDWLGHWLVIRSKLPTIVHCRCRRSRRHRPQGAPPARESMVPRRRHPLPFPGPAPARLPKRPSPTERHSVRLSYCLRHPTHLHKHHQH